MPAKGRLAPVWNGLACEIADAPKSEELAIAESLGDRSPEILVQWKGAAGSP